MLLRSLFERFRKTIDKQSHITLGTILEEILVRKPTFRSEVWVMGRDAPYFGIQVGSITVFWKLTVVL